MAIPSVPYRGIRPFRFVDHPIFFARAEESQRLASLVSVYRGVMLYGDSGSGKSSLVNAGLIPEIRALGFTPERIRVQPRPGAELVVERNETADDGGEVLPSLLADEMRSTARTVLGMAAFEERVQNACKDHRPLLIFDQFEELVTLFDEAGVGAGAGEASPDALRDHLVELLVRLLRGGLPVKLLLSFREDYLGRVKELLHACPELVDQALRLAPPKAEVLDTIIGGPFEQYPDHFEHPLSSALTGRLVDELSGGFSTGQLSLSEVQTVCLRLWQSDDPDALLTARKPQGLLEDYLGEALEEMPSHLRPAAIALLSQMVTSAGTRNVISAADLFPRVLKEEPTLTVPVLEQALERLSQSRLVRPERRRDLDLYEITSEFLVPWISQRRDELRRAQERRDEELRREQERRKERRKLLLLGAVAGTLLLVVAVVLWLALWALTQRDHARDEARTATSLALASDAQVDLHNRLDVGLLLSLAALEPYGTGRSSPAIVRSSMIGSLQTAQSEGVSGILHGGTGSADAVAFSPDGRMLVTGGYNGAVRLWDPATHRQLRLLATENGIPVNGVAFSPDRRTVAAGSTDGTVRLWNLGAGGAVRLLHVSHSPVFTVAFSPVGRLLAVGDGGGTVSLWDADTGGRIAALPAGGARVNSVAFSPDGRTLAAGGYDGRVRLWRLAPRRLLRDLALPSATFVDSVAFSPDGRTLAAGDFGGTVWLWDAATGLHRRSLTTSGAPVRSVAFSRVGHTLAAGGYDGTVWLWSLAHLKPQGMLPTAAATPVMTIAFSPAGHTLAAGSFDGTVRLWSLPVRTRPATLTADDGGNVTGVVFLPSGATLAAGSDAGHVWLWRVAATVSRIPLATGDGNGVTGVAFSQALGEIAAGGGTGGKVWLWPAGGGHAASLATADGSGVDSVAFSPGGRMVAAGADDGKVWLWNAVPRSRIGSLRLGGATVNTVAFGPDGRTLAAGGGDGTVRIWNLGRTATHITLPTTYGIAVNGVAFSPDGRTLAAGASDGRIRFWDVATGAELGVPIGANGDPVQSVAFSPDGLMLAAGSGGNDGSIRFWDVATRQQLGLPLHDGNAAVLSVAFSPNGRMLAAGGNDGNLRLWSGFLWSNLAQLKADVCGLVGAGLSPSEWARYEPSIAYQNACPVAGG
jgi:WD40 repeat protein